MSDTKQLKYAAKAAGFKVARIADDGMALMLYGVQEPWNPRTDNWQSFELALLAGIAFCRTGDVASATCSGPVHHVKVVDGDIMSAAREVVLLAAAEIGKAME